MFGYSHTFSCDEHEIPGGGAFGGVKYIEKISEIEF